MPDIIKEPRHTGEYIVSEANGSRSREVKTVTGADYEPGTVLGQVTATKKFKILTPGANDGSQNAAAILYDRTEAAAGDKKGVVHIRDMEANGNFLVWPVGITEPQKATATTALEALGILVRN